MEENRKSIYDKVKDRVGMVASVQEHVHSHHNHGIGGGWSSYSSNASLDMGEAFKALCDILEEELFVKVVETPKEDEFLNEDEMNIK